MGRPVPQPVPRKRLSSAFDSAPQANADRLSFLRLARSPEYRNLIYTGITRGKRLLVLIGQKKVLGIVVRNDRPQRRSWGLQCWRGRGIPMLLEGARYSLEQCGRLLSDATALYRAGSGATAVGLAMLGRDGLGKHRSLLEQCEVSGDAPIFRYSNSPGICARLGTSSLRLHGGK